MRSAEEWFDLYGESHQNKLNKAIHWCAIPIILVTTLGLIQSIPFPFLDLPYVNWATVFAVFALAFYASISLTVFLGMTAITLGALILNQSMVDAGLPLFTVSAATFFVAWVFQFIGHKVEGKKPSFFQDLQFLLVGPAWLLQFVYKKVGIPITLHAPAGQPTIG